MKEIVKQRIEQIKKGKVPDGYCYSRAGIFPNDWEEGILADVLYNERRAVTKPKEPYWRVGIRSHAKGTFHEYVEHPETVNMDELYVVKENDLIINITFAWEHAVALAGKEDDGLLVSHRFPTYTFKEGQNPFFYKNLVTQKRFKELLALISPGGAGRNRVMSKRDFLRLPCNIPPLAEQQKIAEILMQCDKVIELCEKMVDELKNFKKACLQKMFPRKGKTVPEIRFPDFTDDWEQRKLGEVAIEILAGGDIDKSKTVENGKYPIYANALTNDGVVGYYDDYYRVKAPAVTVTGRGEVGFAQARMVDFTPVVRLLAIRSNHDCYFLENAINNHKVVVESTGVPQLTVPQLSSYNIFFPKNVEEETRIGELLHNFDNLITLHQRKLEEQKKYKKSLMQLLLTGIVRVKI